MPKKPLSTSPHPKSSGAAKPPTGFGVLVRGLLWLFGLVSAGVLAAAIGIAFVLTVAFPNLPDVSELANYRPKLPLRVYSADQVLLAEFGEERRQFVPIAEIPKVLTQAILAAEDANFYQHGGVDMKGIARALLANLGRSKSQGASTISMQVARNVYLTAEKTYTRKIYEVLMTFKLEHELSKDQILQIYMNQIYLGRRAYGFGAASQTYFNKPLRDITIAEAAMLAGLPKAPSAYNPVRNPRRAQIRQHYVIDRMRDLGYITEQQAVKAKIEKLGIKGAPKGENIHAEYVSEMVRQVMVDQYGADAYTRGLDVTTTINAKEQTAAYEALRKGLITYESRQHYRGPEKNIDLPKDPDARAEAIDDALSETPDNGNLLAAVVVKASPSAVTVVRNDGEEITIKGKDLSSVESGLKSNAQPKIRIRPGSVVRIVLNDDGKTWTLTQTPEVEGGLVSMHPRTGEITALVGGFDFSKNKFNHVTQSIRQPGSSFKPFIYSAAIEKGITPTTVVNDAPLFFSAEETGSEAWEPQNYDDKFDGPLTVRRALALSKNMVSIRVLQVVGTQNAQKWVTRFGFEAAKHPPYLTMALGAGSVNPLQMVVGYSVFANGGHLVSPKLIRTIRDQRKRVLFQATDTTLDSSNQVISARNAFMVGDLLNEVARSGTGARAQRELKRPDLFGKTGTTNDSQDAWFVGYQPSRAAAVWVGYDNPRKLGSRETGGGLSLPIWIDYMRVALEGTPIQMPVVPTGIFSSGGDWYFSDMGPDRSIRSLGMQDGSDGYGAINKETAPESERATERSTILNLFRN